MTKIKSKQIIALGGGGFSTEPENLALDRYILQQSGVKRPKVCFIGTASGDSDRYLANFYAAISSLDARPCHLPLFQRTPDIKDVLLQRESNPNTSLCATTPGNLLVCLSLTAHLSSACFV